ncbi:M20/M25/M40 family metallo-hydrolase [Candidatus Poribacteria bacterium]|nr:M20/M25/M40 family metallo-hydrolase [Candidatus Poribacteria bacterium]
MDIVKAELKDSVDSFEIDKMGSLIATKKGNGAKAMLAAHADEIGLIITHIDKEGFLRFSSVGGVSTNRLDGMRVVFAHGLVGTIGLEKSGNSMDKMYIDIGVTKKEEAQEKVNIGDFAVFRQDCVDMGNRMIAKAMDDRIGCVVLVETAKRLKNSPNEVYFAFTVQEEVGCRGAGTSAYALEPDIGIAVDVTRTGDTPEARTMEVSLGKGPAIKVRDSSVIAHPKLRSYLVETAKELDMPYQLEVLESGGTDAGPIQRSRGGVPAGVISIPTRYVHSPSEMIDIGDVEGCVKLLVAALQKDLHEAGF